MINCLNLENQKVIKIKTKTIEVVGDTFTQTDRLCDERVEEYIREIKGTRATWVDSELRHHVICEVIEGD